MQLDSFGLTDRGLVRRNNEDSIMLEPQLSFYAVADGMGGHKGGEYASRICLESMRDYLRQAASGSAPLIRGDDTAGSESARLLGSAVRFANQVVREAAEARTEWSGMGSTVVALLFSGNRMTVANVGDSRCYLLRSGQIRQLTEDHSWVAEQVRAGVMGLEEALKVRGRNILTRAIGHEIELKVDLTDLEIQAGDTMLLCSDGLYNLVTEQEMAALIQSSGGLEGGCRELVACANGRGGNDNISVLLVSVVGKGGILAGVKRFFTDL